MNPRTSQMQSEFLIRVLMTLALLACNPLHNKSLNAAQPNKNVVLIVADDLGLQLGAYGDPHKATPRLDKFAQSAVKFTQARCTTASCSASRSQLRNQSPASRSHDPACTS